MSAVSISALFGRSIFSRRTAVRPPSRQVAWTTPLALIEPRKHQSAFHGLHTETFHVALPHSTNFATCPLSPRLCFNLENDGILSVFLFQLGDIIVAIDKQEINTEADLFKILESRKPGDEIAITAER